MEVVFDNKIKSFEALYNSIEIDSLKEIQRKKGSSYYETFFLSQWVHIWQWGKVDEKLVTKLYEKYNNKHFLIRNKDDLIKKEINIDKIFFDVQIIDKQTGEVGQILAISNITWHNENCVTIEFSIYSGILSSANFQIILIKEKNFWHIKQSDLKSIS